MCSRLYFDGEKRGEEADSNKYPLFLYRTLDLEQQTVVYYY